MALDNSFIISLMDRFKQEHVNVLVDKVSDILWYVGLSDDSNALKHEKKFWIFELRNSGSSVDILQAGSTFSEIWNDRLLLIYKRLSEIINSNTDLIIDSDSIIGDGVATFSAGGGYPPYLIEKLDDIDNKFAINSGVLELSGNVNLGSQHSVDIKITDNENNIIQNTFVFTVGELVPASYLEFNGTDESLQEMTVNNNTCPPTNMTIIADVYLPYNTTLHKAIASRYHSGNLSYIFGILGTEKVYSTVTDDSGTASVVSGTSTLALGQWHRLAMRYDGTNNKQAVFANGVKENELIVTTNNIKNNLLPTQIGAQGVSAWDFYGNIKTIAWYDRALTDEEINSTVNPLLESAPSNLTEYLELQDLVLDGLNYTVTSKLTGNKFMGVNMTALGNIASDV